MSLRLFEMYALYFWILSSLLCLYSLLPCLRVSTDVKIGVGATTLMEQLIVFRKCCHYLAEKGIEVVANIVGEVLTVQEMAGFQLFIARMDDELLKYWNAPCRTPYYKKRK